VEPLILLIAAVLAIGAGLAVRVVARRLAGPGWVPPPDQSVRTARNGLVRIAYQSWGAGPPLVLIGGLGHGRWSWEPVIGELARDFQVVAMDNRGIGASDAPMGPYFTRLLAADVLAVMDHAGIRRASLVGVSLGGMIAQQVANDRPDRVDRLVLVSTIPGGALTTPMPVDGVAGLSELPLLRDEAARAERGVRLALAPATVRRRPRLARRLATARAGHPVRPGAWVAQAAAGMLFDLAGGQRRLRQPTLIVQGTEDVVVHPDNARTLAGLIPGAELVWFERAGHLPFWEQPRRFTRLLRRFLLTGRDDAGNSLEARQAHRLRFSTGRHMHKEREQAQTRR
jgi:3-oxoadipate enol-lactonase